jgi:hypothetical protein
LDETPNKTGYSGRPPKLLYTRQTDHDSEEARKRKTKNDMIMKTACCNTRHIHVVGNETICVNNVCTNYLGYTKRIIDYTKLKTILAVSTFIISFLFSFDDFSNGNHEVLTLQVYSAKETFQPISPEALEAEMVNQRIICVPEVIAQIRLESGNMSSFLFRRTNNMLGMRFPFRRETTASGIFIPSMDTIIKGNQQELKKYAKLEHYAAYDSWQDAVKDYKLWQESNFKISERYLEFLGKVYAEDSLYTKKIRKMTAMK